jgi:hypothetical protein
MTLLYVCPVCGYNELSSPPEDWKICPCCLTEFGYNDVEWGVDLLRKEWIEAGAKWESEHLAQPEEWSPIKQLLNIDYHVSSEDKISIANHSENSVDIVEIYTFRPSVIPSTPQNTTVKIPSNVEKFVLQPV